MSGRAEFQPDRVIDETVLRYGGAEVQMRQIEVTGPDGQVSWQRFELAIETDSPGVSRIVDLKLRRPADDALGLWPWMQPSRPGMRNALLLRWLESGRRPIFVTAFPDDGWLVLRGQTAATLEARGQQDWLFDRGSDVPLHIKLDAPWAPPIDGTGTEAERTEAWMQGLRRLMQVLQPLGADWKLEIGVAPESSIAIYAFTANDLAERAGDLILHIHRYDPNLPAPWFGSASEPARTFCTARATFLAALVAEAAPDKAGRVSLERLISNPDVFSVDAGLSRHAFDVMRDMGLCN